MRISIPVGRALVLCAGLIASQCLAEQVLHSVPVETFPNVDGHSAESEWEAASPITVVDPVANIPLEVRAVHDDERVCFLVRFADPDESRTHRSWVWNERRGEYEPGPDREDVCVLKWFMTGDPSDLSLFPKAAYTADIWFWKACRTDPMGYADDKMHRLDLEPLERGLELIGAAGEIRYLERLPDKGKSAYQTRIVLENEGAKIDRFENVQPTGSRSDVRARGRWVDGMWTIEFARKLHTGNPDDVQLSTNATFRFGISRYEVAGRNPEPAASQPNYGCGEISEIIILHFDNTDRPGA